MKNGTPQSSIHYTNLQTGSPLSTFRTLDKIWMRHEHFISYVASDKITMFVGPILNTYLFPSKCFIGFIFTGKQWPEKKISMHSCYVDRRLANEINDVIDRFNTNGVRHTCNYRKQIYLCWFKNNVPSWSTLGLEMS